MCVRGLCVCVVCVCVCVCGLCVCGLCVCGLCVCVCVKKIRSIYLELIVHKIVFCAGKKVKFTL